MNRLRWERYSGDSLMLVDDTGRVLDRIVAMWKTYKIVSSGHEYLSLEQAKVALEKVYGKVTGHE